MCLVLLSFLFVFILTTVTLSGRGICPFILALNYRCLELAVSAGGVQVGGRRAHCNWFIVASHLLAIVTINILKISFTLISSAVCVFFVLFLFFKLAELLFHAAPTTCKITARATRACCWKSLACRRSTGQINC